MGGGTRRHRLRGRMQILIDTGTTDCRNMGDVAMLQVAVSRLGAQFPEARLQAFTEDPAALAMHCPDVEPVAHVGRMTWSAERALLAPLRRVLPQAGWLWLNREHQRVRRRWPSQYASLLDAKERLCGRDDNPVAGFVRAVREADLLFVTGQGTLSDGPRAWLLLDTIDLAIHAGVPVALLGQGVGPIWDSALMQRARETLPRASLIALREERRGRNLLLAAGVSPDRMYATGDDAIELAYQMHPGVLGDGVGLHLRRAPLALPDRSVLQRIGSVVQRAARARRAPLVPVPISQHVAGANDAATLRDVLHECDTIGDGGASLDTPAKVIAAAGRCRVVVTGAYHAAVFALAQGVPVVCLGTSEYYLHKFEGLVDQFGAGCAVIRCPDPYLEERIAHEIDRAWQTAQEGRERLLKIAERQIALSRAAYRRIPALLRLPGTDGRSAFTRASPMAGQPASGVAP